jgi:protein tyrosine/serine phosphatase
MSSPSGLSRPSRSQSILFFALFIAAAHLSFSQPNNYPAKISNFGQVNKNYYRGGQPDAADFAALKQMGVKTIIDLQKDGMFQEASWAQNAGLQYFRIPLSSTRPANAEQTACFLKLVNDPANWPVFVHCAGGRHRTGEMTAIYRINHDAWNADGAFAEMKQFGYYAFPNHGSLKNYVYKYFQDFQSSASHDNPVAVPIPAKQPITMIDSN